MKALRTSLIIALLFLLSILSLELLLRLLPPPRFANSWVYDAAVGHRGPRNQLIQLPNSQSSYNHFGFRGENPTPKKLRRLYSIFLFGDSITEAVELPWRRAYPKHLEAQISVKQNTDVEVTNFASSDYGTTEAFLLYALEARHLLPDLVLLQFLGLNDFINNSLAFAGQNKSMSDFARPYVLLESDKEKYRSYYTYKNYAFTYLSPWKKFLREKSRLYLYASLFLTLKDWDKKQTRIQKDSICSNELEIFLLDPSPSWLHSYQSTQRLAKWFHQEVEESHKTKLLALYFPSFQELSDVLWEKGTKQMLQNCFPGKSYERWQGEKKFLELFGQAGVDAISLRPYFPKDPKVVARLFLPGGHLSAEGHRLVAEAIYSILKKKNLIPPNNSLTLNP